MSQPTFKQMIKDGTIKRADAMKVRYADLHVEPGFNLRDENEAFHENVLDLAAHIGNGGTYPPLEVRPRQEGGVLIVDGHCRHRAIGIAIEAGAPIEWVEVRPFVGNDAARTMRVLTSSKGRRLSSLETARGYQRLVSFGLTIEEIAKGVNKSGSHVREALNLLNNGNVDVHNLITTGVVSASVANQVVREHGDKAAEVITAAAKTARESGKRRVTASSIKPRPLPTARVRSLVDEIRALRAALTDEVAANLPDLRASETVSVPAGILRNILAAVEAQP
jgi:ParB/RepB/Spo0J family partition protein